MTADRPDDPLERLRPEVKGYVAGPFALWDDLERLRRVQRVGAWEAAVLYCTRILEALAAAALRALDLPTSPNLFANLDVLQQLNLIQQPMLSWAHALRGLGNAVRHVHRRVEAEDAELSVLFVERCLDWYFCRFRGRPHRDLQRLTDDDQALTLTDGGDLRPLILLLEAGDSSAAASGGPQAGPWARLFRRTPALPGVMAELLLERKQHEAARTTLDTALAEFPGDLRLRQLLGLYYSRTRRPAEAFAILEPLFAESPDDETAGLLGGVCKRLWQADRHRTEWLSRAHDAYLHGWHRSRHTNAYPGINAATTALWLGQPALARAIAEDVRRLLQQRAAVLQGRLGATDLALNYWDQVSLAEALLLLSEFDAARRGYLEAFDRHPGLRDSIKVTREQVGEILPALGARRTVEEFLPPPAAPGSP